MNAPAQKKRRWPLYLIVAALLVVGQDYYRVPVAERIHHGLALIAGISSFTA